MTHSRERWGTTKNKTTRRSCEQPGCYRKVLARGLCKRHYDRERRRASLAHKIEFRPVRVKPMSMRMARLDPRGEKVALLSSILHEVTQRLGLDGLHTDDYGRSQWVIIESDSGAVRVRRGWYDNMIESNLLSLGGYVGSGSSRHLKVTQMGTDWIKQ
jgi:hypothetical protein